MINNVMLKCYATESPGICLPRPDCFDDDDCENGERCDQGVVPTTCRSDDECDGNPLVVDVLRPSFV